MPLVFESTLLLCYDEVYAFGSCADGVSYLRDIVAVIFVICGGVQQPIT
jgi:hypothetical protein